MFDEDGLLASVLLYSDTLYGAHRIPIAVFDFADREFVSRAPCVHCQNCEEYLSGRCDFVIAHSYGGYEAVRWKGVYIYFCPLSLVFVSTVVFQGSRPMVAMVAGPVIMGMLEDFVAGREYLTDSVQHLARKTTEEINDISKIQWVVAMFLSGRGEEASQKKQTQSDLHNALYQVSHTDRVGNGIAYPVDLEKRLQKMITNTDKDGARVLINDLLSSLYFHTGGDFSQIRSRAKELMVIFTRASIEGGADPKMIFQAYEEYQPEFDRVEGLDDLSVLLTSVFHRFVSCAFDFGRFKHTDIMHKAVNYVREYYSEKITLEMVAEYVNLSRSYLSTIFKEELDMNFTDFVNKIRVEKSELLLMDPRLSLSEIAMMTGFADQSYYTKIFTKVKGVSPGQYRRSRGTLTDGRKN